MPFLEKKAMNAEWKVGKINPERITKVETGISKDVTTFMRMSEIPPVFDLQRR